MAVTSSTLLFRGAATTNTATTLYTVGAGKTTVITSIVVSNTGSSAYTFTLAFDGTPFATTVAIAANSVAIFDMKQVLGATKTITGGASNTAVVFHISGAEIA